MSGQLWALLAGMGFGVFQASNRRAVQGLDVYVSTFLQLIISTLVLTAISLAVGQVGLLRTASLPALINFGIAGLFHFFIGWTFLNASQKRIGAARTSPLISTVPLFATIIAAFALREIPRLWALAGVAIVVMGVYIVALEKPEVSSEVTPESPEGAPGHSGWRGSILGLCAALCWSISPVFIRRGLAELQAPLLGLTIGMVTSVAAYAVAMSLRGRTQSRPITLDTLVFKVIAGSLVGLSQWGRWIALGLAPVGVVLAITQVSTPVAILLSPVIVGRHVERVTRRVWLGAAVIIGGSVLLILSR